MFKLPSFFAAFSGAPHSLQYPPTSWPWWGWRKRLMTSDVQFFYSRRAAANKTRRLSKPKKPWSIASTYSTKIYCCKTTTKSHVQKTINTRALLTLMGTVNDVRVSNFQRALSLAFSVLHQISQSKEQPSNPSLINRSKQKIHQAFGFIPPHHITHHSKKKAVWRK